jgi:hypoxanthine-DNA glycosylase
MCSSVVHGFEPVARRDAWLLILGSMPGEESLRVARYYANPRNAFWPILGDLLGFDTDAAYRDRLRALRGARIALWDVLRSCRRRGSLDANIDPRSLDANDFRAFFGRHRGIRRVLFNGGTAQTLFLRHVLPRLDDVRFTTQKLPSTSPANASWSYARKLRAWRSAVDGALKEES